MSEMDRSMNKKQRPDPTHRSRDRKYAISPQVHADRTATFRYQAPKAQEVGIRLGRVTEYAPMTRDGAGIWHITLGPFESDIYEYRFIVDDIPVADPNNPWAKPSERPNTSIVDIPADRPSLFDAQNIPHGSVSMRWYWSEPLGVLRRMLVYTPPDYDFEPNRAYPVLYLLHGTSDTEETWVSAGRANFILDALINAGKARPMIVVMPYGRAYPATSREAGSLGYVENMVRFQRDLLGLIIPHVETHFRAHKSREGRAIAGLSGGGGETLYIGLNNVDKFAWICGFSSAIRENEFEQNYGPPLADARSVNEKLSLLWLGCGSEDHLYQVNLRLLDWLKAKGINHVAHLTTGGHDYHNWRSYLVEIAQQLFVG
jgi:enterochelin esterase family protein